MAEGTENGIVVSRPGVASSSLRLWTVLEERFLEFSRLLKNHKREGGCGVECVAGQAEILTTCTSISSVLTLSRAVSGALRWRPGPSFRLTF